MASDEDKNALTKFSVEQVRIIIELLNAKGLSNRQLTEQLGIKKSNLSTALRDLEDLKVVSRGKPRKSKEGKGYMETPYNINFEYLAESITELRFLELIIDKLAKMNEDDLTNKLLEDSYKPTPCFSIESVKYSK